MAASSWELAFTGIQNDSEATAVATWQDVLKACLYEARAQDGASQTHPLAVMLFLLDGLSVLRCLGRDAQDLEHPLAAQDAVNDGEKAMTRSEVVEHFQIYLSELVRLICISITMSQTEWFAEVSVARGRGQGCAIRAQAREHTLDSITQTGYPASRPG